MFNRGLGVATVPLLFNKCYWTKPTGLSIIIVTAGLSSPVFAQFGPAQVADETLKLAKDSPFRDPNVIYLEADSLKNHEDSQILVASGSVEARYQDKTLRADEIVYEVSSRNIIATGNVVLVQADGTSQHASRLELSSELETGSASDFVVKLSDGGLTAARFVGRGKNGETELYNAYYTACQICEEQPNPSWRIKARHVTQDKKSRSVQYRDATFELFGLPIFYTPYLAHPDPSSERASGILTPFFGFSNSTGVHAKIPYYWAIDDYTETTITPRVYSKVNPLIQYKFSRQFHTGRIDVDGSLTYGSVFDRNGNAFDDESLFVDPENAPIGKDFRGHIFAHGLFSPTNFWTYGFGVQYTSDDNFLRSYDLPSQGKTRGLYVGAARRNTSQAFVVGQNEDTRFTVSAVGFEDRRDRIFTLADGTFRLSETDDSVLPVLAPVIELEHYLRDPLINGRLKISGNLTPLSRETGSDYTRGSVILDYSKTWVVPGGIEIKPFGNIRGDYYDIAPDKDLFPSSRGNTFIRSLGQMGADVRYPFIKTGDKVTWILEPRVQVTKSFGDAKLDEFDKAKTLDFTGTEDAGNADLSAALLWQTNKSSGYDFWQEGTRLDYGGNITADWGRQSSASLFLGQSYSLDERGQLIENISTESGGFLLGSGLSGKNSDIIGEARVNIGRLFNAETKLRYDDDTKEITRIYSTATLRTKYVDAKARYFLLNSETSGLGGIENAPSQALSGSMRLKATKNWSASYGATLDLDRNEPQKQSYGIRYQDDCTLLELSYTTYDYGNDALRNRSKVGFRVSLLNLADFKE